MSDLNDTVVKYLNIWNEPDTGKRAAAIAELFTENAAYVDPLATVEGHTSIAALIEGARTQFPGLSFELLGEVDTHHNVARFQWGLVAVPHADPVAIGFDVAVADNDGRLVGVYGFLDKVPS